MCYDKRDLAKKCHRKIKLIYIYFLKNQELHNLFGFFVHVNPTVKLAIS